MTRGRLLLAAAAAAALVIAPTPTASAAGRGEPVGGARLGSHGIVRPHGAHVPRLPKVHARAYLVSDLDTGKVLAAKDPHGRYAPASTLKVLTALAVLGHIPAGRKLRPTYSDMSVDGSKVGVDRRRTYRAGTLCLAMLMVSANDAARTVARAAGGHGGIARTVARMNAVARRLHAYDTHSRNPTGLDAKEQTSSAYDLTLLFRAAMKRADFRRYVQRVRAQFPDLVTKKHRRAAYQIYTHNRLLVDYRGDLGGKNGYTIKARASYVGAARRHGHTVAIALMRARPDFWDDAAALLDWGFAARRHARPVGALVAPGSPHTPTPSPTHQGNPAATAAAADPDPPAGGGLPVPLLLAAIVAAVVVLAGAGAVSTVVGGRRRTRP